MNMSIMKSIVHFSSPRVAKTVMTAGAIGVGGGMLISANVAAKDLDPKIRNKAQFGLQIVGTAVLAVGAYLAGVNDAYHFIAYTADDTMKNASENTAGYIHCEFTGDEADIPGFIAMSDKLEDKLEFFDSAPKKA